MAYTSSSLDAPIRHKYDVFLSFRGEDTRYSFTDHLYDALLKVGLRTFRDDDEIHEGQELKPEIERSITESRSSVIVLSENFANSSWCLDELCLILEQKRKGSHFVLPMFYGVDPSDVRNQRGSFKIESTYGIFRRSIWKRDNVNRWKAALTEVANLKGSVVSGYETTFIPDIVEKVYSQLGLNLHNIHTRLTGIETRANIINSWLRYEDPDFPVLAIGGMGGCGKTTLAEHIYYSNKHNFDSCSLLKQIEKQPDGLLGVQKQLLRDISGNNNIMISNVYEGAIQLGNAIQMNKVLIVVDDIDDKDKLSTLFGTKVLYTQSKIIITTRLLNINTWFDSISWRCHVHNVELLDCHESVELLSFYAFGCITPMEGFEELAVQLARYCGGNPLALKVLGSSLFVSANDPWTKDNMKKVWESRMKLLQSSKGDLDGNIQGVLQKSFESLPCNSHKELFLHIACLFLGEYSYDVEMILESDYHAISGMVTLINRCLVTVSKDSSKLMMHKLIQDMARSIVSKDSKDPAERSRVWRREESYHLLRNGDGSKTIEGLALKMKRTEQGMRSEAFKTSSIVKMKNLKFLHLRCVKLTGSYKNFPNLRWLRWDLSNLKRIPQGFPMSSLVAIYMRNGALEKFEPPMVFNSLKILDLSFSYKLVSICNFHKLPKIETLLLSCCTNLTYVCKTIEKLENLSYLSLTSCTKLWKNSSKNSLNQKFISKLERLKALNLCGGTQEQPFLRLSQSVYGLNLARSLFKTVASYIDITMLQELILTSCPNIKSLPRLPCTLKGLYVEWCSSLENITFQSGRFKLESFYYEGCFKLCEIEGLFNLVPIVKLKETDLVRMQWIKVYQDQKVDLVGDVITKGRTFNIQMLHEYGIMSTYLQGIEDQSMATHQYTSLVSPFLSFRVPLHPKKHRIHGLDVSILYRSSSGDDERYIWPPLVQISNTTKGLTWVYSPVVYCKPKVDDDVVWLSSWPIGNMLDTNDEIQVIAYLDSGMMIARGCGASLVYIDDGQVENGEMCEGMKGEEVIGGDLSLFEVTKGSYFLCRRYIFMSTFPHWFSRDTTTSSGAPHDSGRWRISCEATSIYEKFNAYRNPNFYKMEVELGVSFNSESETDKMEKAVYSLVGVDYVSTQKEKGRLYVVGHVDPHAVVMCVREFEKVVQVLNFKRI